MMEKTKLRYCLAWIALIILLALPAGRALGEQSGRCGDSAYWTLDSQGVLTIRGSGEVASAKWGQDVKKLVILEGITGIGGWAFSGCSLLKEVTLPDSLARMGGCVFSGCSQLKTVTLPEHMTGFDQFTRFGCDAAFYAAIGSKTAVAMGDCGLPFERPEAPGISFQYERDAQGRAELTGKSADKGITAAELPRGVEAIGPGAFDQCKALTKVKLPDTLKRIGGWAFNGCDQLRDISLPSGLTVLEGCLFQGCESLKSLTLPDGITQADSYVFFGCGAAVYARIGSQTARTISEAGCVFRASECPAAELQYRKNGKGGWNLDAVHVLKGTEDIAFPEGVTGVDGYAFSECKTVQTVTFPSTVTHISAWTFSGCGSLESIVLAEGARDVTIEDCAFAQCPKLRYISIPDSVRALSVTVSGLPTGITCIVGEDSYACRFARDNGLRYVIRGQENDPEEQAGNSVPERVREIVAAVIRDGMTDYQKALALHNYLTNHAVYDHSQTYYGADGVLLHGKGVCNSYTDAYALLLDAVGIANWKEYGANHIWNVIRLNGKWCHVDVTWDDPGGSGWENCMYFGLTDYALEGIGSHERQIRQTVCNSYEISYAFYCGALDRIAEKWTETLKNMLSDGQETYAISGESGTDCINERMAVEMLRDKGLPLGGYDFEYSLEYLNEDMSGYILHVSAAPSPQKTETPAPQPGEKTGSGDVNGDGSLDGRDLLRLARYLAGDNVEIDEAAADVNGDGKVDGRDLLRLAKLLAGL